MGDGGTRHRMQLEICVDSVESAIAAQRGGADRLELCGNLIIGGTTPDPALLREIRRQVHIPVRTMIRPRYGDFCYSESEFRIMCEDVRMFRELGADGIVIGMMHPDGTLDVERMGELIRRAKGMGITLHRCFDLCRDPFRALEEAVCLGVDIVLTSGQAQTAAEAPERLRELHGQAAGRILIQAGSGVTAENIGMIYSQTGITAYHMSGKETLESRMEYRREGVSMGLPSFSEFEMMHTDERNVRRAREVLDHLL